jgi:hypothetical protein
MDAADKPEKAISTTLAHRRHTRRFQSGLEQRLRAGRGSTPLRGRRVQRRPTSCCPAKRSRWRRRSSNSATEVTRDSRCAVNPTGLQRLSGSMKSPNVEYAILTAATALWHAGVNGGIFKCFLSEGDYDRLVAEFGEPIKVLTFTRFAVEIQDVRTGASFVSGIGPISPSLIGWRIWRTGLLRIG